MYNKSWKYITVLFFLSVLTLSVFGAVEGDQNYIGTPGKGAVTDSFSDGDYTSDPSWNLVSEDSAGISVTSSEGFDDSYSLNLDVDGDGSGGNEIDIQEIGSSSFSDGNRIWAMIKFTNIPSQGNMISYGFDDSSGNFLIFKVEEGVIGYASDGTTGTNEVYGSPSTDTWYNVTFEVVDVSNGDYKMYVFDTNGNELGSTTVNGATASNDGFTSIDIAGDDDGTNAQAWVDLASYDYYNSDPPQYDNINSDPLNWSANQDINITYNATDPAGGSLTSNAQVWSYTSIFEPETSVSSNGANDFQYNFTTGDQSEYTLSLNLSNGDAWNATNITQTAEGDSSSTSNGNFLIDTFEDGEFLNDPTWKRVGNTSNVDRSVVQGNEMYGNNYLRQKSSANSGDWSFLKATTFDTTEFSNNVEDGEKLTLNFKSNNTGSIYRVWIYDEAGNTFTDGMFRYGNLLCGGNSVNNGGFNAGTQYELYFKFWPSTDQVECGFINLDTDSNAGASNFSVSDFNLDSIQIGHRDNTGTLAYSYWDNVSYQYDAAGVPNFDNVNTTPENWREQDVTVDIDTDVSVESASIDNVTASVWEDGTRIVDGQELTNASGKTWEVDNLFTVDQKYVYYNYTLTASTSDGTQKKYNESEFIPYEPVLEFPSDEANENNPVDFDFSFEGDLGNADLYTNISSNNYRNNTYNEFNTSIFDDPQNLRDALMNHSPELGNYNSNDGDGYLDAISCHLSGTSPGGVWWYESNSSDDSFYNDPVMLVDNQGGSFAEADDGCVFNDLNNDGINDVAVGTSTDIRIRYGSPASNGVGWPNGDKGGETTTVPFNDTQILGDTGDEHDYMIAGTADGDISDGRELFINTDFDQKLWMLQRNTSESDGYNDPQELIEVSPPNNLTTDGDYEGSGIQSYDYSGDGISDIIFTKAWDSGEGRIYILESDTSQPDNYSNSAKIIDENTDGIRGEGSGRSHLLPDVNGDGYPELVEKGNEVNLFLSNMSEPDYFNDPKVIVPEGYTGSNAGFIVDSADFNEDGHMDIIFSQKSGSYQEEVYLLMGDDSNDYFEDSSNAELILDRSISQSSDLQTWPMAEDINNDGTTDIFFTTNLIKDGYTAFGKLDTYWQSWTEISSGNFTDIDFSGKQLSKALKWNVKVNDTNGVESFDTENHTLTVKGDDNNPPSTTTNATTNTWLDDSEVSIEQTCTDSISSVKNISASINQAPATTSQSSTLEFSVSSYGNNTVDVSCFDTANNAIQDTYFVNLGDKPDVGFSVNISSVQVNETVGFDGGITNSHGAIGSREWDFESDGAVDATGIDAQKKFTSEGSRSVTFNVSESDTTLFGSQSKTVNVYVNVSENLFGVEQDLSKTSDTDEQHVFRNKQLSNLGSGFLAGFSVSAPSIIGNCQNCNSRSLDIDGDQVLNTSYNASGDWIENESSTDLTNASSLVKYGEGVNENYTSFENLTAANNNSNVDLDIDISGLTSSASKCSLVNSSTQNIPVNTEKVFELHQSCEPAREDDYTFTSTVIGNRTFYEYNSTVNVHSERTSEVEQEYWAKLSRFSDFSDKNDSTVDAEISGVDQGLRVRTESSGGSDYLVWKALTNRTQSSVHSGTQYFTYSYNDTASSDSSSPSGGTGGTGGSQEQVTESPHDWSISLIDSDFVGVFKPSVRTGQSFEREVLVESNEGDLTIDVECRSDGDACSWVDSDLDQVSFENEGQTTVSIKGRVPSDAERDSYRFNFAFTDPAYQEGGDIGINTVNFVVSTESQWDFVFEFWDNLTGFYNGIPISAIAMFMSMLFFVPAWALGRLKRYPKVVPTVALIIFLITVGVF